VVVVVQLVIIDKNGLFDKTDDNIFVSSFSSLTGSVIVFTDVPQIGTLHSTRMCFTVTC